MQASHETRRRWIGMAVVMIATFMSAVDGSVVNVALPVIGRELGVGVVSAQWVVSGYLLSISSLLLVFGRLADAWGYGLLLATGFVLFGLSSAACGFSGSLRMLVAARAVQGIGASMLMASGPALVTTSFPGSERGRALGLQATATYLGLALGPFIGGFLTSHFGWHSIFFVNIPIAAGGTTLVIAGLHPHRGRERWHFDAAGAALFALGLTLFLFGLARTQQVGWRNAEVLVMLAAGPVLLALFLWREATARAPLLPLALFRSGAFSGGVGAAWLQYLVIFVVIFLAPFYLQRTLSMSPEAAGAVLTSQPAMMVLVTAAAGWLSDRIGTRIPSTAGMIVIACGTFLLTRLGSHAGIFHVAAVLALIGLGVGLFTTPNNSAIMGAAPRDRQGVASGLLAAARNVGMVCGVSTGANLLALWQSRLLAAGQPPPAAFLQAFQRTLFVAALLALVGAGLCLFRPPPPERAEAAPARDAAPLD